MDPQKNIENIEKQILAIKNNSDYQRLLTTSKGLKDDQRFRAYSLQLQTLILKRDKILFGKNTYPNNGKIQHTALKSPSGVKANQQKEFSSSAISPQRPRLSASLRPRDKPRVQARAQPKTPTNQIKKNVHQALIGHPVPRRRSKLRAVTQKEPEVEVESKATLKKISTGGRTMNREEEKVPEKAPDPIEPMVKPVRTSIKLRKVPISKLSTMKTPARARTIKKPVLESLPEVKPEISSKNKKPKVTSLDNIEDLDSIDIDTMDKLLEGGEAETGEEMYDDL